jgi:predicted secreted protein
MYAALRDILYLNPRPLPLAGNRPVSITTAIAIYFIIWWVVLFAVLPWGVRSQEESGEITPGSDPGAPVIPRVRAKLVWTTIVATVVFAICTVVYSLRLVTLDQLAALLGR